MSDSSATLKKLEDHKEAMRVAITQELMKTLKALHVDPLNSREHDAVSEALYFVVRDKVVP